jgi:hypothetical protein
MVDSPDSHFIVQKPALISGDVDNEPGWFGQRESNASWFSRIQGYFF